MQLELISALALIICITIFRFRHLYQKTFIRFINEFPGPKGWPFVGNALTLMMTNHEDVAPLLISYYKKWPKYFCLSACNLPTLFICNAQDAEKFLSSSTFIGKGDSYRYVRPWLRTGLLTSKGQKWQTRRKLLTPSFHFQNLADFIPVFNEQSDILMENLNQNLEKSSIDILSFVTLCTFDIVCESVMGVKVNAQINYESRSPYLKAVERIKEIIHSRMKNIYLWPNRLFSLFPEGRDHAKCLKILHEFSDKVIRERKIIKEQNPETESAIDEKKKHRPFLDLLLEASNNGHNLSNSDIREEVDTFMFGGHDTTAVGIGWALFLLGHNQQIQKKVHEELDSIFGDDTSKHATIDDLKRMKYLECVIKEAQRMYPSVPLISRQLTSDVMIDGKIVPSGLMLTIATFLLHRDPAVFPNPETFDPSRFFAENSVKRNPYAYVPFSAGPRNCIGQKFGMLVLKVVLSRVLRSFVIKSLEPQDKIKYTIQIITVPKNGVNVHLTPRNIENVIK